jgi:hypothetical protein
MEGEYDTALAYYNKGFKQRPDIQAFQDGIFKSQNNLFRIRLVMLHFNRISAYPLTRRIPLVEQELLIYPEHEKSLKIPKG